MSRPWRIFTGEPLSEGAQRVLFRLLHQAGVPVRQAEDLSPGTKWSPGTVITTLGSRAFNKFHSGKLPNCRGSIYTHPDCTVIPTFSPLDLMKVPTMWPVACADVLRAYELSKLPETPRHDVKYISNPTVSDFISWLGRVDGYKPISLDIETDRIGKALYLVGLGQETDIIAIPFQEDFIPYLIYLFKNHHGGYICQNGNFDRRVIHEVFGFSLKQVDDTMLSHHLVCSELPHDLGFIASLYSNIPYYKDESGKNLAVYNCKDVDATWQASVNLTKDMQTANLIDLHKQVMLANEVIFQSILRGLLVHVPTLEKFRSLFTKKSAILKKALLEKIGDKSFNPNSPKQVTDYLYNKLKLAPVYDRKTGAVTSRDEPLLKKHGSHPIVKQLLEYRHSSKMLSTYLFDFSQGEDIDLHFEPYDVNHMTVHLPIKLHGTASGRYSSFIHTWPPAMREIIVPYPGNVFIAADYSQIEWRLGAFLSQDPVALEILSSGKDIHLMSAVLAFKKPADQITKHERHLAKRISHGSSYGIGPASIAVQFGITKTEAIDIQSRILAPFKHLLAWRENLVATVEKQGYLVNPFGRRRYFLGGNNKDIRGEIFSFMQQSTCHDMIMRAANTMFLEHPEIPFVLDHHDENIWQTSADQAEASADIILEIMQREHLPNFSCPSTITIGRNWLQCKEEWEKNQVDIEEDIALEE